MRGEKRAVQNQRIAKVVFTMSDGDAICFSLYCGRDFPRHGRQKLSMLSQKTNQQLSMVCTLIDHRYDVETYTSARH